uniref:cytochrome b-c1 complex subunit 8-like n=1 Tax=Osmia lignaria TaxID=473952 RepID=UPI0014780975|nr:cytochrome b-c1 complex subunit 8-like [Osmia lignaria]
MTMKFGELPVRIRRVVYYTLAADEQRFWAKFISHSLPEFFKRSLYLSTTMAPAFLMTLGIYTWSHAEYKRVGRKNPALYEKNSK